MASPFLRLRIASCIALFAASAAPNPASAAVLAIGHGYGATPEAARAAAGADLALRLQRRAAVRLDSVPGKTAASTKRAIAGGRELPLIKVELSDAGANGAEFLQQARLTDASLAAYEREATRLAQGLRHLNPSRMSARELDDAFAHLDQYLRIRAVLGVLSSAAQAGLELDESQVWRSAVSRLTSASGARDVAQKVKLERADIGQCRIVAPVRADSAEATALSASITEELHSAASSAARDEGAECTLDGRYTQIGGRIVLTLFLLDAWFNTQRAFAFVLPAAAGQSSRSQPTTNFAATLSRGLVRVELPNGTTTPSSRQAMEVDVRMGRGNRGLFYRPGERDKLFVKLDRSGYYYIVGHLQKEAERFSYLMEIGEPGSAERFVRWVSPDQARRWQTVSDFTVEAPTGLEAVQVFATSEPPQKMLPPARFDPKRKLHLIGTDPVDAIERARGLVLVNLPAPRYEPSGKVEPTPLAVGEAVLQFSTLP